MKRLIAIIAALCAIWDTEPANAGCRVACRNVAVVEQVVPVAYATAIGVPVAQPYAVNYQYTPTPPAPSITVNVQLDRGTLSAAMKDALTSLDQQQQQNPLPSPPPVPSAANRANPPSDQPPSQPPPPNNPNWQPEQPARHGELNGPPAAPAPGVSAVAAQCFNCHSPSGSDPEKVRALAKIDLTQPLTDPQRIQASRDVLTTKMPHKKKLSPEEAGDVLSELVGAK